MMNNWNEIINCINEAKNIVIFTHNNMDGDAIGSSLALCNALNDLGKSAKILINENVPKFLQFLCVDSDLFVSSAPENYDLAIAVDCGDESRIEGRLDAYKKANKHICIDHHIQKASFAEYSFVDSDCAACGMLIFKLLTAMNFTVTKTIGEELYTAILTDTGRFMYNTTTPEVHEIIANLLRIGIDFATINNNIYASYPLNQIKLEAMAIDNMQIFAAGKAIISYITQENLKKANAPYELVDTCIDRIRIIQGTEVACMIKEKEPGFFKVSLRSKNDIDVQKIASSFGGGGHLNAAACSFNGSLEEFKSLLMERIEKAFK